MAQRYGGAHSPDGKTTPARRSPFAGKRVARAGARLNLLFLAPLPLAWRAFASDPLGLALNLLALGMLLLSAWLTREGMKAEDAYNARATARKPALPRKMLGAALTGLGLAVAGASDGGVIAPVIYAVLGAGLHLFSFGIDPLRDKGADDMDLFQSDRVARAVAEAERHLADMAQAARTTGDRRLVDRVMGFQSTVREMFRTVENDPRDLTAARKYLGVYLLGAKDATVKYAELHARGHDAGARGDYEALLDDLEANFAARTRALLEDDRSDLDIEIGVLRDRLAREGLATE